MSEEKSSPIGTMIVVAIAAGLIGYVIGKPTPPQVQAEVPDASEKTAEPQEPAFMKEGLVAHYPFNGNAKDESGNGNDGLAANVKYVSGGFGAGGKTAEFAKGSSIKLNASKLPQGNSARTMSCFVRVTGAQPGTETTIASWGNAGSNNQTFAFYGDSFDAAPKANGFLAWSQWGSGVSFTTKENEAKQDVWYHITATFDGKTLVTYLNGKKADQKSFTLATGAGDLVIGQLDFRRILEGHVDEFRIYNRALSDENVADLYKHDIGNTEPAFLKEGLVAYYPFNGNAKDESGNGNDGDPKGNPTLIADRKGNANQAYDFDGIDDWVNIKSPQTGFSDGSKDRAVSVWLKVAEKQKLASGNGTIGLVWVAGTPISGRSVALGLHQNAATQGKLLFGMDPHGGPNLPMNELNILDGKWHNLVWSYSNQIAETYLDGIKIDSRGFKTDTVSKDAFIGGHPTYRSHIASSLDDLRIYNRALTEEQVKALYDWEKPKAEKPAEPQEPAFLKEGLVAYYPFNGNAKDESGNGIDGKATDVEYVKGDSGVGGKAAKFSGGSTIRASAEKLPQGNSPASISCLVKVTGVTRELHIGGWGDRGRNSSIFALFGDGFDTENGDKAFLAWTQWAGGGCRITPKGKAAKLETWYHLLATFDGKKVITYLNGKKTDEKYYTLRVGSGPMLMGNTGDGRSLIGLIDELRIYNRALTEEQVKALYEWEKPKAE